MGMGNAQRKSLPRDATAALEPRSHFFRQRFRYTGQIRGDENERFCDVAGDHQGFRPKASDDVGGFLATIAVTTEANRMAGRDVYTRGPHLITVYLGAHYSTQKKSETEAGPTCRPPRRYSGARRQRNPAVSTLFAKKR